MTEEEQLQLAMAISASEAEAKAKSEKSKSKKDKEKSKIKVTNSSATDQEVSAIQRFTQALDSLDSGDLVGALSHLTAAIDSLPAGASLFKRIGENHTYFLSQDQVHIYGSGPAIGWLFH